MRSGTKTILGTLLFHITMIIVASMVHTCYAQPPGFQPNLDSVTFIADPALNSTAKQITGFTRTLPTSFSAPITWLKVGLYTAQDRVPVSHYLHFSGFQKDSIDTSSNPTVNISVIVSSYTVIVPKAAMGQKIPIIRVYEGGKQVIQDLLITSKDGAYYVTYLSRTKLDQTFKLDFDGSADPVKMATIQPIPGKYGLFAPMSQTVKLNIVSPELKP